MIVALFATTLVCPFAGVRAAALSGIATLGNPAAGATTSVTFSFTVGTQVPNGGWLILTKPTGYANFTAIANASSHVTVTVGGSPVGYNSAEITSTTVEIKIGNGPFSVGSAVVVTIASSAQIVNPATQQNYTWVLTAHPANKGAANGSYTDSTVAVTGTTSSTSSSTSTSTSTSTTVAGTTTTAAATTTTAGAPTTRPGTATTARSGGATTTTVAGGAATTTTTVVEGAWNPASTPTTTPSVATVRKRAACFDATAYEASITQVQMLLSRGTSQEVVEFDVCMNNFKVIASNAPSEAFGESALADPAAIEATPGVGGGTNMLWPGLLLVAVGAMLVLSGRRFES